VFRGRYRTLLSHKGPNLCSLHSGEPISDTSCACRIEGSLYWQSWHSPLAGAQDAKPLRDLSLEELMNIKIETVVGASERLKPVTEAPSSVTIVTADDIARHGSRGRTTVPRSGSAWSATGRRAAHHAVANVEPPD
jgi:hypothetical protein